jgi:hypothetical protein
MQGIQVQSIIHYTAYIIHHTSHLIHHTSSLIRHTSSHIPHASSHIPGASLPGARERATAQYERHRRISQAKLRKWERLMQELEAMQFPMNPLDALIEKFGVGGIAEITGRKKRMVNGQYITRLHGTNARNVAGVNLSEIQAFQAGSKRIAIISEAGAQGISLHSSLDDINQQERVHVVLEAPFSTETFIQQCGRSHRSHQKQPPTFIVPTAPIPGETRLLMAVATKLQTLGALTRGDRRAGHIRYDTLHYTILQYTVLIKPYSSHCTPLITLYSSTRLIHSIHYTHHTIRITLH